LAANQRKVRNLAQNVAKRQGAKRLKGAAAPSASGRTSSNNFEGDPSELWCPGGECAFVGAMARESQLLQHRCLWFSSLVSRVDNLPTILRTLDAIAGIKERCIFFLLYIYMFPFWFLFLTSLALRRSGTFAVLYTRKVVLKPYQHVVDLFLTLRCTWLGVSLRWLKDRNHHRYFSGPSMMTTRNGVWRGVGTFSSNLVRVRDVLTRNMPYLFRHGHGLLHRQRVQGQRLHLVHYFCFENPSTLPPGQSRPRSPNEPVEREDAKGAEVDTSKSGVGLKPVGVRRYWGSGPWGALPLGWYHQQVMTMNICSLGHHRTQPRPARAALLPCHALRPHERCGWLCCGACTFKLALVSLHF